MSGNAQKNINISSEVLQRFIQRQSDKATDLSNMTAQEFISRFQKYADQERQEAFNKKIKLSKVEYDSEKDLFIATFTSEDTHDAYCRSINFAEGYASTLGKSIMEFTPSEADEFIYSLKERSPASVRRDIAAVSSFFTFLERRHTGIPNTFHGTRARPKKKGIRLKTFPATEEVNYIVSNLEDEELSLIVYIMAHRGLRVGAFKMLFCPWGKLQDHKQGKFQP